MTEEAKKIIVELAEFSPFSIHDTTICVYERTRNPFVWRAQATVTYEGIDYVVQGNAHYNGTSGEYTVAGNGWIVGFKGFEHRLSDYQGRAIYDAYRAIKGPVNLK